ncbi:MAG: hypothetical protein AAFY80_00820 [Pseudomonadota bacterium]
MTRHWPQIVVLRLARGVALVGLAIYLLGTIISIATSAPEMFQRFGSLGVAAAVLFFTDRLLTIELNRQKAVEKMLHEYGLRFEALSSGIAPGDLPTTGYSTDFLHEESAFNQLRRRASRTQTRNIVLLTAATLQWGFGDLFLTWTRA